MDRRSVLKCGLAAGAFFLASAHTPYRQWKVYRQKHLLIGTSRGDEWSYPLGQLVATVLSDNLPSSRAQVSRAPDRGRLASLISTGQMPLVILSRADAGALAEGAAPFVEFGGVALRALFRFGDYLLVSRPDFPERHAYLVAGTLAAHAGELPDAAPLAQGEGPLPVHAGALAMSRGQPPPPGQDAAVTDAAD